MRLTLRTLLAYLDDILDEQDAHELGSKINESEVATQLVQRIRQVVGQSRFDAPHIDAQGIGADANSVAEYLDNTLPADLVPDFEQACLDSDMHLGEVAACHQILTLVLGEPAEVSTQLKRAVHSLGSDESDDDPSLAMDVEHQPIQPVTKQTEPPPKRDADEHWTKAPDYLVKRRRSVWKPIGIAALIAFCLVLAGLRGIAPLDRHHPLAMYIMGTEEVAQQPTDSELTPPQTKFPPSDAAADTTTDETAADSLDSPPDEPDTSSQTDGDLIPQDESTDVELPNVLDTTAPPDLPTDIAAPSNDPTADLDNSDPLPIQPEAVDPAVPPEPAPLEQPSSVQPNDDGPEGIVPVFTQNDVDDEASDDTEPDEPTEIPDDLREIGRFLSEDQLLTRYDMPSELWRTVLPRASVMQDDRLMVFPLCRPQLMLATGIQVTLVGPARVQLLNPGPDDVPDIRLDFGRAEIVRFPESETMIGIHWGTQSAIVTLADSNSTLAVEVARQHEPGGDIENEDPRTILRVVATSGNIQWQTAGQDSIPLTTGQQLSIVDAEAPQIADGAAIPEWIDGRDARPIDPVAVRGLIPHVPENRPVSLSLREQAESNRQEVQSLAVCSLAYLGQFDPLLVALNDNRLKSYWAHQYRSLRQAASLDVETAARVRLAIEERHGEEGQQLFRMLRGYSPEQLLEGGAQLLVDSLDHPSSDFRVAAIENLKAITGIPSLYMPHYSEKARRKHVIAWRNKLNKGQIKYRNPPPEFSPPEGGAPTAP